MNEKGISADIVIKAGILITMKPGNEPMKNRYIVIKGDKIVGIENRLPTDLIGPDTETIDASSCIVMPGLINAHTHLAMTLFRGLSDDLPLKEWLFNKIFPSEKRHLNPESVFWGALLGCAEMISFGTTTFVDGYFFQDFTIEAAERAGLRGLIAQGVIDFPAPGVPDPSENLSCGKRFIERWKNKSDLLIPGIFCHSPLTCSQDTLKGALEISKDYRVPLQIHLSETRDEVEAIRKDKGMKPVFYLDSLGLLSKELICVHGVHLDDDEIAMAGEKCVNFVLCPESNLKLASGVARVPFMMEKKINMALGTDGCASNNNLDMFQEMDTAIKIHKGINLMPELMKAEDVLRMATIGGAKMMGVDNIIGTVEVNKKADIIIIDTESPHLVPLYDPYSAIVYSAKGNDVRDVIVNGRVLMRERSIITIDVEEAIARVSEISKDIMRHL